MAWATIRRATADDVAKLNEKAAEFAKRHDLPSWRFTDGERQITDLDVMLDLDYCASQDYQIDRAKKRRLRAQWMRIVRRALGSPNADGIAHGCVGYSAQ